MSVQKSRKPMWPLYIAIASALVCIGIVSVYVITMNMVLGVATLPFVGLAWFFYYKWANVGYSAVKLVDEVKKSTGEINSFNIYARTNGNGVEAWYAAFEHIDKPLGIPRRFPQLGNAMLSVCVNKVGAMADVPKTAKEEAVINPFSGVLADNEDNGFYDLVPLELADAKYCSPSQLARVVNMDANRNYYNEEITFMQELRPWILIVAIIIGGIILIAVQ